MRWEIRVMAIFFFIRTIYMGDEVTAGADVWDGAFVLRGWFVKLFPYVLFCFSS